MKHPPYHLRPNKAADRFIFFELLGLCNREIDFTRHKYLGFGGPFMVDFREVMRIFPSMPLLCLERDYATHRRQRFHAPKKGIRFIHSSLADFVAGEFPSDVPLVVWLDFNSLREATLESFEALLQRVDTPSIIRITVPAKPLSEKTVRGKEESVRSTLGRFVPDSVNWDALHERIAYAEFVFDVFRHTIRRALNALDGIGFEVLQASTYRDTTAMISVTGIVGDVRAMGAGRRAIRNWDYAWTNTSSLVSLECPILSMKERMHLEQELPSPNGTGRQLARRLGYLIGRDSEENLKQLDNYRRFHQAYPFYGKFSV